MSALQTALNWRKLRELRLAKQKEVDALHEREVEVRNALIAELRKAKNKSVSNGDRLFQLVTTNEPFVEDWGKLQAYVQRTGEFDLIQRRVNPASVKLRWDDKKKVPGVGAVPVDAISDTKAKS